MFTNSLAFGQALKPDRIFILSALHHLLDLDKEIEDLNNMELPFKIDLLPTKFPKPNKLVLNITEKQNSLK